MNSAIILFFVSFYNFLEHQEEFNGVPFLIFEMQNTM